MVVAKASMSKNYFQLLGLDSQFDIDKKLLLQNYRQLQSELHPDKYAHASDMEKRLSVQQSSMVNDAYQTLKDPLRRAIYLLQLHGVHIGDNESSMDSAFLMQQMSYREKLDTLRQQSDTALKEQSIETFIEEITQQIQLLIKQISELFTQIAKSDENDAALQQIKDLIMKMQFFRRLQQQAEEIADNL